VTSRVSNPRNSDIYTMNADGSARTQLTNEPGSDPVVQDFDPAWSPDGTKLAFVSSRTTVAYEIFTMNADGSAQTAVTNTGRGELQPAWSPDGTKIAFSSFRDNNSEIYVMNADGSAQTRLTNTSLASEGEPAWSPDGTKIAFACNCPSGFGFDIWVMNADGSAPTLLTTTASPGSDADPVWSPDGTKIAFEHDVTSRFGPKIFTMNPDGSDQTALTTTSELANFDPAWSPDGTKITFAAENFDDDFDVSQIYTMNLNGSALTRLTDPTNPRGDRSPDWQPGVGPKRSGYKNAAQFCKAERDFLGDATFAKKYGTNGNGANAHGKCAASK